MIIVDVFAKLVPYCVRIGALVVALAVMPRAGALAETKSARDLRIVGDYVTHADYAIAYRKNDSEVVKRAFAHPRRQPRERRDLQALARKALPSAVRLSPRLEAIFRMQRRAGE